jgi:SAM-dependent methyltransferase
VRKEEFLTAEILRNLKGTIQVYLAKPYRSVYLPYQRSNEKLSGDDEYVNSAVEQLRTLQQYQKTSSATRVFDFGCGQGRLAIGLLLEYPELGGYLGIDTDKLAVKWCQRWIHRYHDNFSFRHVDAHNELYNPTAFGRPELPVVLSSFDLAMASSVFTHMLSDDVRFYLRQINHALKMGGVLYLTAFIEKDVPPQEENPLGYLGKESTLPLHRVRYEQDFFLSMVKESGFKPLDLRHQGISRTKQSELIAEKISDEEVDLP